VISFFPLGAWLPRPRGSVLEPGFTGLYLNNRKAKEKDDKRRGTVADDCAFKEEQNTRSAINSRTVCLQVFMMFFLSQLYQRSAPSAARDTRLRVGYWR